MRLQTLALAAALCVTSAPVWAATITVTDGVALDDVEIGGTLSVAQFDTSLGTLTGVTWSITGETAGTIGLTNMGTDPISGTATTSVAFDLVSAALSLDSSPDFTVTGSTGTVDIDPGETETFSVGSTFTISGSETASLDFIGAGTVDVDYATLTGLSALGFGGDLSIDQATDAGISLSVTYEYDEVASVPLPASSAALLASFFGLIGMAWLRRRQED